MDDFEGPESDHWQPAEPGEPVAPRDDGAQWPPPPPPPGNAPAGGGWGGPWQAPPQGSGGWPGWNDPTWGSGAGPRWAGGSTWDDRGAAGWGAGAWGGGAWSPQWQDHQPTRPRRTLPSAITAILVVAAVLVGIAIGHGVWRSVNTLTPSANNGSPGTGIGGNSGGGSSGSDGPSNVSSIAAKADPALVDIDTQLSYQGGEAAGTGIVLTSTGLVITNNHVINGETQIQVTDVGNSQSYSAKVLGYDHVHDVALVQMSGAHGLTTANFGDSAKVSVGEGIVGIGNAGGVGGTPNPAGGVVTALDQSITATDESNGTSEQLTGLIEVDANIQEGDSGGALVNGSGQVVGIDTAASQGFSFQATGGQGFAIPIDQALAIAHQIEAGETSSAVHIGPTAFLGVFINPSGAGGSSGASLRSAIPGGPAAHAGLAGGDVITSVDGHTVGSSADLTNILLRYHPGDKVQLGFLDSTGQTHQATVQLSSGPPQ